MKKKILTAVISVLISAISFGATITDSLKVSFGNGTAITDWTSVSYYLPVIEGKYTIDPQSNYFGSSGSLTGIYPSAVDQGYIFISNTGGLTNLPVSVVGIESNLIHVLIHVGSSSASLNNDTYIKANGVTVDTINPYLNASIVDLGYFPSTSGSFLLSIYPATGGYACINSMVIYEVDSTLPRYDYTQVSDTLVSNFQSSQATKNTYDTLRKYYGNRIISGFTGAGAAAYNGTFVNTEDTTGVSPYVYAIDMTHLSPNYPYAWSNEWSTQKFGIYTINHQIDSAISRHSKGHMISAQWHWHAPSGSHGVNDTTGAFGELAGADHLHPSSTDYSLDSAIVPGTRQYDWMIEDLDTIAYQLKLLEAAGVPVLWRPLHEADGGWFWWGTDKTAFIELWNIMYNRFTYHHNLTNLIWVYSQGFPESNWMPAQDQVDIIAFDWYPGAGDYSIPATRINICREQGAHKKIVALTEVGPIPDISLTYEGDNMYSYYAAWSWESLVRDNSDAHFKESYNNPITLNRTYTTLDVCDTTMITASSVITSAPNGTITLTSSGGTPAYTYLWSNGQTSNPAINLDGGVYSVIITDANGCTGTDSYSVPSGVNPCDTTTLLSSSVITDAPNGTITLTVIGGVEPYTYLWSDDQTSNPAVMLSDGSYSVTITDNNGCNDLFFYNVPLYVNDSICTKYIIYNRIYINIGSSLQIEIE